MDRMVSLTVGTTGAEDYQRTFMDISELARNMVDTHEYVNVSAQKIDEPDESDEPGCNHEQLHHDDVTLIIVRQVLQNNTGSFGKDEQNVTNLISALQNAGILFRERPRGNR